MNPKFVLMSALLAAVVFALSASVEAASPVKMLAPKVVKVVSKIPAAVGKAGNAVSNFVWRNKGSVAVGTALVTFATHPKPFLDAATTVATGGTTDGYGIFGVLAVIAAIAGLVMLYRQDGLLKYFAIYGFVLLMLLVMLTYLGGVARADEIGGNFPAVAAPGFLPNWRIIIDVVLIVLTLLPLAIGS